MRGEQFFRQAQAALKARQLALQKHFPYITVEALPKTTGTIGNKAESQQPTRLRAKSQW